MTQLLEELRDELSRLARIYLPSTPVLIPSLEDQERARAFVIFCHAEIEWYIERAAETYLSAVCNAAKIGLFNFSSISLIASSDAKFPAADSLGGKKDSKTIATIFGKIEVDLKAAIESNNGVREKNISKILGPLGMAGKIDGAWLSELDSLASMRGKFAHMSGSIGTATIASINPEDVRKLCDRIVEGNGVVGVALIGSIRSLDEAFERWKTDFSPTISAERTFLERILRRLGLSS